MEIKKINRKYKILGIITFFLVLIVGFVLYACQERTYFYLSEDKCITMWKTDEGIYLIPGKYTSWFKPEDNYIKANSAQEITIYYSDQLPNVLILRNESNEKNWYKVCKGKKNTDVLYVDYSPHYEEILYKPDAIKFSDLKEGASSITIDIAESYASTNDGRILR